MTRVAFAARIALLTAPFTPKENTMPEAAVATTPSSRLSAVKPKIERNTLDMKHQHILNCFVVEHYLSSKKSDQAFSVYAAETLGFHVSEGNIWGIRKALEIADNTKSVKPKTIDSLLDIISELEARITRLEQTKL